MNPTTDLIACHGCDLLLTKIEAVAGKKHFCPRCHSVLIHKKVNSINKVLAISISGLIAYIPAIFLPLLTLHTMGMSQSGSIFDAFLSFYNQKYYIVATLVFITSVFFPLLNLSLLFSVSLQLKFRRYSQSLPFLFRAARHLDEWGMPDVYLIALLVTIVKISGIATIDYNIGFFCFIFLVLMARASTSALDPDVFWERIEEISPPPPAIGAHDAL